MAQGPWIQTFSGLKFYPFDPGSSEIRIEDIAHSLGLSCRFRAHCLKYYSVAEHCVLGSYMVPSEHALRFLLHDASEAYFADLPRPIKILESMADYRRFEHQCQVTINARFGLSSDEPPCIKEVDTRMLFTEKRDIMAPAPEPWAATVEPFDFHVECWTPEKAEQNYLDRFRVLTSHL